VARQLLLKWNLELSTAYKRLHALPWMELIPISVAQSAVRLPCPRRRLTNQSRGVVSASEASDRASQNSQNWHAKRQGKTMSEIRSAFESSFLVIRLATLEPQKQSTLGRYLAR